MQDYKERIMHNQKDEPEEESTKETKEILLQQHKEK